MRETVDRSWMCCGLGVVVLMLLLGCAAEPEPPEPLRIGYQHSLVSLDPHAQNDGVTGAVLSAVYETLVWLEPGASVRPGLAARWTTPDDTTWRFELRDGVRFHDGRLLTVEDVVASIRRARFDADSQLATYMEAVENVRVVEQEGGVIEVSTAGPFPLFLSRISMVAIVPQGFDPSLPIGTGPYRWHRGSIEGPIELHRWPEYWGEVPDFEQVVISFVEEEEQLAELIAADNLDVMAMVTANFVTEHSLSQGWRVQRVPTASTTLLGLNVTTPPLDDPRVREALDLAIDRQALVLDTFPTRLAEPAVSVVSAEVFGFLPPTKSTTFDQARARALLREAGVAEGSSLRLDHSGVYQPVVDYLVRAFGNVGLELEVEIHTYGTFYQRMLEASNELFLFGWTFSLADASDFLDALVHTRDPERMLGMLNGSGYGNASVDAWIEAAAAEPRSKKRLELLHWSLARVARERPYLPLYHRSRLAMARSHLQMVSRTGSWVFPQDVRRRSDLRDSSQQSPER